MIRKEGKKTKRKSYVHISQMRPITFVFKAPTATPIPRTKAVTGEAKSADLGRLEGRAWFPSSSSLSLRRLIPMVDSPPSWSLLSLSSISKRRREGQRRADTTVRLGGSSFRVAAKNLRSFGNGKEGGASCNTVAGAGRTLRTNS
jgi:hypothetical protein